MNIQASSKGRMREAVLKLRVAVSHATDRRYGIRTEGSIELEEFGLAHPERLLYVPSSWRTFGVLAKTLRPTPEDTFVDFGSGKGRVVMMMAQRLVLRRIVGVEIAPDLATVAQQNLEANRSRLKTQAVDLITSDAAAFRIPDDMTIAYIYSSFTGEVFHCVIRSIEHNLRNFTGRRLVIVLQYPTNGTPRDHLLATNDDHLRAQPWLKPLERVRMRSAVTGWRSEIAFYDAFDHASGSPTAPLDRPETPEYQSPGRGALAGTFQGRRLAARRYWRSL